MNSEQLFSGTDNQWKRKAIEFNGFALSYLEGGKRNNGTIFFIHGWGLSSEPYQDCLNALAETYWVIAPDLPGFGQSPCSFSLSSYQTYANCILQLCDRLNLNKFYLIGHSFGGAVALALAAAAGDRIMGTIAINSTGIPMTSLSKTIEGRFAELPQQLVRAGWQHFAIVMQALAHNIIFNRQHLIEGAQIASDEDLRPWLKDLKSPCLIVWSDRDYFTPIEIGYGLVEAIPHAKLQLVDAKYHEWCMVRSQTVVEISRNFFAQIKSSIQTNYESTQA